MTTGRNHISMLLVDLRVEMERLDLWSEHYPSEEAMASVEPFAVDTMDLEQWLQFFFIARLQAILDAQAPLPASCEIAPYAEQRFQDRADTTNLIRIIQKIDAAVTESK
ncbi:YqcC family protein [Salinispirillum sp. LH 10-3-1]|uniref:YqcC family protein n=1 Tax=Salinispirillum sp. LH 10-3-1 TaxID=2952525 RepID=A0AB38YDW3_9GAMM